jgi:hypothetical protein
MVYSEYAALSFNKVCMGFNGFGGKKKEKTEKLPDSEK